MGERKQSLNNSTGENDQEKLKRWRASGFNFLYPEDLEHAEVVMGHIGEMESDGLIDEAAGIRSDLITWLEARERGNIK